MARDRQRAKQRRSKQPGARGSSAGAARPRTGGTPAPDPLKGALPDVEEARLAEAGAVPLDDEFHPRGDEPEVPAEIEADDDFGPDLERAPDDLERDRDLASARSVRREAERDPARHPGRGRLLTFLGHVIDELRRVQWPDRRQVGQGTLVTLIFVLVAGGYLGLLDAIWKPVIEAIL
jgi:preprotein translocase SecE subunit